jgi:3-phenylpropionate/cinnamic acid dioxygenase small subunit
VNKTTEEKSLVSDRLYREVSEFLFREAQLLDNGKFKDWLELLSEEIRYRLVASSLSMSGPRAGNTANETVLMDENLGSFKVRVQQLTTPAYTIAENPRTCNRRFITNILVDEVADDGLVQVHSNALVYRSHGSLMEPRVFSMARRDSLKWVERKLRLVRRDAQLDESVVGVRNIAVFF